MFGCLQDDRNNNEADYGTEWLWLLQSILSGGEDECRDDPPSNADPGDSHGNLPTTCLVLFHQRKFAGELPLHMATPYPEMIPMTIFWWVVELLVGKRVVIIVIIIIIFLFTTTTMTRTMEEEDNGDDDWEYHKCWMVYFGFAMDKLLESTCLDSIATTMMNTAIATRWKMSSHHDDETNNKNKNHFVLDNETQDNPLFFYKHNNLLHNFYPETSSSFHNDFSAWEQSPPTATTATTVS